MALFMLNEIYIKIYMYCRIIVEMNVQLPTAVYLDNGIHAVSTFRTITFQVTCHRNTLPATQIIVNPPLEIVTLALTCVASHPDIILLLYYLEQIKYNPQNDLFLGMLRETNFPAVQIWEPFVSVLPNYSKIELPETLKEIPSITMNNLIDKLTGIRAFKQNEAAT